MVIVWSILFWCARIYLLALWGRFFLELIVSLRQGRAMPRGLTVLAEVVYTVTDPPVRLARRLIPPLRIGPVALDFGVFLSIVVCSILVNILNGLR